MKLLTLILLSLMLTFAFGFQANADATINGTGDGPFPLNLESDRWQSTDAQYSLHFGSLGPHGQITGIKLYAQFSRAPIAIGQVTEALPDGNYKAILRDCKNQIWSVLIETTPGWILRFHMTNGFERLDLVLLPEEPSDRR